jgi:hypothetical protein
MSDGSLGIGPQVKTFCLGWREDVVPYFIAVRKGNTSSLFGKATRVPFMMGSTKGAKIRLYWSMITSPSGGLKFVSAWSKLTRETTALALFARLRQFTWPVTVVA